MAAERQDLVDLVAGEAEERRHVAADAAPRTSTACRFAGSFSYLPKWELVSSAARHPPRQDDVRASGT